MLQSIELANFSAHGYLYLELLIRNRDQDRVAGLVLAWALESVWRWALESVWQSVLGSAWQSAQALAWELVSRLALGSVWERISLALLSEL